MASNQQTLPDLLFGSGIKPKNFHPGHSEQVLCPHCEGGRTHERSLSVTIDDDGLGAVWQCHRGSCGWTDGGRLNAEVPSPRPGQRIITPDPVPPSRKSHPDWMYDFFAERQIGARTVDEFGIYSDRQWFSVEMQNHDAIVFPFFYQNKLVNRKYRPYPEKSPQKQDKDALATLFNVDRVGNNPEEMIFVEGEPDVMALFECGIQYAVTLKDGAPKEAKFRTDDKRFEALRTHSDMLLKVKRFVLAGDMDAPGLALREELARRFGRHRCWLVTWPDGLKDACDVLRQLGPEAVINAIGAAEPYPIDGVQRIKPGTLMDRKNKPQPKLLTTGTEATDAILHLPSEGRLIAVTGYPNSGKSTWLRFVMIHTARAHNRRWAVFSPEMQPWEDFAVQCAECFIGKPFWAELNRQQMDDAEINVAERWLEQRVCMLVCDAEDQLPTLDWIFDRAKAVVLRDGVTDLLIDPWNEVEHERSERVSETDYIGRALQRAKAFGQRYGCNIWIVVHPTKPFGLKTGEKRPAPGPYDASGSAHWANKPDLGITVHAPDLGCSEIHLWKARFRRFGQRGKIGNVGFDDVTGRYYDLPPAEGPSDGQ